MAEKTLSLQINASPHIKSPASIQKIMWAVVAALIPAGIAGVYIFGIHSLYVIATSVISAFLTELIVQKLAKKPLTYTDGSAVLTGLLLAYNLPPSAPLWMAGVAAVFAIAIVKQTFGGLGRNIFNPALAGRAFCMASWPIFMTRWTNPRWFPDTISSATPLAVKKSLEITAGTAYHATYLDLFLGNRPGCIGEVCVAALLVGALFLLIKGYIKLHIPLSYIGTTAILSWLLMGKPFQADMLFYVLSGGLILGAFFMATDYVTSPVTSKGKIAFGIGCGILTVAIRKWGGYPEGVSYSILIMNSATPIIDRFTKPARFGAEVKKS